MNLLNEADCSKFVTRKWNIFNDTSNANYYTGDEVLYNAEVLKSNLCDYSDAYILVRGDITILGENTTQVAFKDRAPCIKCITKIDGTTIDNAEYLDLFMLVYNLLEYSYSDTAGSLWFYSKDEATTFIANITNTDVFKSFKYNAKLLEDTVPQPTPNNSNGIVKGTTIALLLTYLSNFWSYLSNFWSLLQMPLIKCKV